MWRFQRTLKTPVIEKCFRFALKIALEIYSLENFEMSCQNNCTRFISKILPSWDIAKVAVVKLSLYISLAQLHCFLFSYGLISIMHLPHWRLIWIQKYWIECKKIFGCWYDFLKLNVFDFLAFHWMSTLLNVFFLLAKPICLNIRFSHLELLIWIVLTTFGYLFISNDITPSRLLRPLLQFLHHSVHFFKHLRAPGRGEICIWNWFNFFSFPILRFCLIFFLSNAGIDHWFYSWWMHFHTQMHTYHKIKAVSRVNFIPVDQYGLPRKCPVKQKVTFLKLTCLFLKRSFMKRFKVSLLITLQQRLWKENFQFQLFHDGVPYHIGTSPLICIAN